jgi:glucose/arabinose dehydrogenase
MVAAGLTSPTAMDLAPDGRLFIAEQGGTLRVVKNGALLPTPFLSLSVSSQGERGLLGIAFDPNFTTNHFVYVYYTVSTSPVHNRISRFTANGDVVVPGSEFVLMDLDNLGGTNHNGGAIHFGPDGKLYAGVGENGLGSNAQSLNTRLGKMLRINPDGSIPADNPFFNQATGANRAIWALGLRNPFTFAFQPGTGRMFINDVGADTWEEIDDGLAGGNYGWPQHEGFANPPDPSTLDPFFTYKHDGIVCAIVGGAFYNPATDRFPSDYVGDYFFGDLCGGWIKRIDLTTKAVTDFAGGISGPVDIKVAPDGSLYYLAHNSEQAFRVQFVGLNPGLRQTVGVFDPGTANWYLRNDSSPGAPDTGPFAYGGVGWTPVAGDWNGDRKETVGVFNPANATWYLKNSNTAGAPDIAPFAYGGAGWIPVAGDWDGNGTTTIGVFDPSTATWYIKNSNSAGAPDVTPFQYGAPGWIPLVGDWDGDGRDGIGVFDPSTATFYLKNAVGPGAPDFTPYAYGAAGWVPVAGDWDGDGKDSVGVFDPGFATWYLKNVPTSGPPDISAFAYGGLNWRPVPGRWNPSPALLAASGPLPDGADGAVLTQAQLDAFVRASGLGGAMPGVRFEVRNLGGAYLGLALVQDRTVLLDDDAAGYGWFVDPTPFVNEEFDAALHALAGGPADGRMDLLTAVRHELGHLAGLDDVDGPAQSGQLMVGTLAAGTRRA